MTPTRSRTIISVVASLTLGTLMAGPALGALSASPNPSTTGSYTVSGSVTAQAYHDWVHLVETLPSGTTTIHTVSDASNVSVSFSGKPVGTYAYQAQGCFIVDYGSTPAPYCENIGTALSVTVSSPPPADPMPDFGTASVAAKSWAQNSAIAAFTVPAASGGNSPLSYSDSGLPAGVSMSSARLVSGTPTAAGMGTATVTVSDKDGDTDTLSFAWTVAAPATPDLVPDFGDATIADQSWTLNTHITFVNVPAATGGDGRLTYSGSGLPAGVRFLTSTRVVLGRPTEAGSGTFTVTVTDADGDTDTLDFDWTVVDPMPDFGTASVAAKNWTQNSAIAAFTVPAASGGNSPLRYAATGLPGGVTMSALRRVSGTPGAAGMGTATVTVTDADGDTDTLDFNWTVNEDLVPSFGTASVADQDWTLRTSIAAFTVPAASGGDGTLRYSVSGLPSGVRMSASTRRVSGRPLGNDAGSGTATVTVRDADGDTATLDFNWTVADPMPDFGNASVAAKAWSQNNAIPRFTVPAATGGNSPLRYSASGLPAGVTMSSSRRVSGTPGAAGTGTATVTVTDSDGDTDTLDFDWTVNEDLVPSFGTASVADKDWTLRTSIAAFTVPAATGGDGTLRYSVSGLPRGVRMASSTRRVSGFPTGSDASSGTATVTVRDADGDTDTLDFNWTVADPMPDFGSATVAARSWTQNTAISRFTVPAASGGNSPLRYSVSGLPDGVRMFSTRGVYGTPTTAGSGTATVTVRDYDGDTDTLSFDWTVAAGDLMPDFGAAAIAKRYWVTGTALQALTVPAATGGNPPLSYTASGLPNGVSMSTTTRRVSGTPLSAGTGTATITVTDVDGDTDTLSFDWTTYDPLRLPAVASKSWTQNRAVGSFSVAATGGVAPLAHTVGGLPAGVTASSSGSVSGTPTGTGSGTATVSVTDAIGNTRNGSFTWRVAAEPVDRTPSFATVSVPAKNWTQHQTITTFTVPAATSGDGTLTYSATGLPAGVTMSADRSVSGTPTASGSGTAIVTATDSDGDTDSVSFNWTVSTDLKPSFATVTLTKRNWTEGQAVSGFTLPAASGGDGTLNYAAGGLPSGVSMDSSRTVSGTPDRSGSGTATVTATDADGDTASVRFAWTVSPGPNDRAPSFGMGSVAQQQWLVRRAITGFTVPAASGGDGTLTYTASGLPAGVTMSSARVVSGSPTATGSGTATVTVTDADGDFAKLSFDWAVVVSTPVLSANPNPSTTGNFTVSWNAFLTEHSEYFLVETAPTATVTSHTVDAVRSKQFVAKPDGMYSYRMRGCRTEYDRDINAPAYRCIDLGNALTVTVDGPAADSVAKQLSYTYTAHVGDFDGNNHKDLLIKRTSAGVGAGIFQTVILSQESKGKFILEAPSETGIMTASAFPVASGVELLLEDFNLDGFVDVLLRGLGSAITGELDRIVYAPGGKVGGHSAKLKTVDAAFKKFRTEVNAWIEDPAYFDKNAVSTTTVVSGFTTLYHCQDETGGDYYTDYPCPYHDTFIEEFYQPFTEVFTVISYGNFNDDALKFSRQFSLVDGRINPDVTLGSQGARNLSGIFEDVLGVEFFNGKLEQACTGTFAYDSAKHVPCDSPTLIGRVLLGLIDTIFPPAHAQDSMSVQTQLPHPTPGIVGYGMDYENGQDYRFGQYGTAMTIQSVIDLGKRWKEKYPDGPPLYVGDISLQGGGPMRGHTTGHRIGKNVDIRPVRNDGGAGPLTYDHDVYDYEKTQELVNEILKDPNVRRIYFGDEDIEGPSDIMRLDLSGVHDNHLHVEYYE